MPMCPFIIGSTPPTAASIATVAISRSAMGQHVALEKVGEEVLFEKHFDFGSQHGVIGFRRIRRDTGDLRENVASPVRISGGRR